MNRRRFVAATVVGGAAMAAGCGPGPGNGRRNTGVAADAGAPGVIAQPRIRWRLASSFPRSTEILFGTAVKFAERVKALTDGRFEIEANEAGVLVPALQVLDAVQSGSVPIGHTAGYYYMGKNPALAFDSALPFGMQARQHDAWMRHGGGLELTRKTLADFGVINLLGGNTGTQMGGWFRRPVNALADLRGMKMRIPGLGAQIMEDLGAIPQSMPGGEIYQALERGAIDAAEWVGPYDDETMGLQRVAKIYHYPGWWEPCASLSMYINKAAFEQLPTAYQAALVSAADEANAYTMSAYDAENPGAVDRLVADGVKLTPFPDDMMQAAYSRSTEMLSEAATGDRHYAALLESYRAFQERSARWFATAERTMADFTPRSA